MTPEQQVKEIILMMNPENPNSTDAVFLVKRYMELAKIQLANKEKQIALLEARIEAGEKEKHNLINEKLKLEKDRK